MNGAQDMGGVHGFGPVEPEPNEPVFHAEWEKRAFALTLAMAMPGQWNIDMSRFARENRDPAEYLSMSYYQIWFAALETMLKERALVSGRRDRRRPRVCIRRSRCKRVLSPDDVLKVLHRGGPTERDTNTKAAFKPGDQRARQEHQPARPTRGCRAMCADTWALSSASSAATCFPTATRAAPAKTRNGSTPCASTAANCGDPTATRPRAVSVDAWEPYLEPA